MKVYFTGSSPFARKVRVAAIETGQRDDIDWQEITREQRTEMVPAMNPLGKVPVAVLVSGETLYDSPVICAYVDSLHDGPRLIPDAAPARWQVLRLEALGDGLGEAVIAASLENQKPGEKRSQGVVDRQTGKATAALDALDAAANGFNDPPLMGEIAVACAMGYMELRDVVPGWRDRYPALAAWYTRILQRPSFVQTAPE